MNLSVIGLGKLGAPLAAVLASKGHRVIGVDVNENAVRAVNEGRSPVLEPGLEELIRKCGARLSATTDFSRAVAESEATFILVPTPSDEQGGFSLKYVLSAVASMGPALRDKINYHLVVVTSTVLPGATMGEILPALERHSGKRCGPDFGLCYNPEFIALGSVIEDMLHPDMQLIGEYDERAGDLLAAVYAPVTEKRPPLARMNIVNAELTKISVNTFVTTKISYANMLAEMCEKIPGADASVVTSALGLDTRIGRKYLSGATAYGGPCFPRDNVAFAYLARQLGTRALLAEATEQVNRQQIARLTELALAKLVPGGRVAILGLSYKPQTDVVEESPGVELARALSAKQVRVTVYDPLAMENARRTLGTGVTYAASARACLKDADVVVVTTPWPEFRELSGEGLGSRQDRVAIIDCWRILPRDRFESVADYLTIGTGPELEQPAGADVLSAEA